MKNLRFAMIGAGFWAPYQLAGWRELDGVECVAICDPVRDKAVSVARAHGIRSFYTDAEELFKRETLDFVDIVASVDSHSCLVRLAAAYKLPVICQKPMTTSLEAAIQMVNACREAEVPFLIHENWRWQRPIRKLKALLEAETIGKIFRARIRYCSSFPVFDNQPFLKELKEFILTDMGSHILDAARFLFGEARALYCQTYRANMEIKGEDVATVVIKMKRGMTVICELAYAGYAENERFPETFVFIEGDSGSIELGSDYWVRVTTESGTTAKRYPPRRYHWADPAYDLVHASIAPCNADLLQAIRSDGPAETTAEDNLETMRLIYASYESNAKDQVINLDGSVHLRAAPFPAPALGWPTNTPTG